MIMFDLKIRQQIFKYLGTMSFQKADKYFLISTIAFPNILVYALFSNRYFFIP